jgi:hypothetical protein
MRARSYTDTQVYHLHPPLLSAHHPHSNSQSVPVQAREMEARERAAAAQEAAAVAEMKMYNTSTHRSFPRFTPIHHLTSGIRLPVHRLEKRRRGSAQPQRKRLRRRRRWGWNLIPRLRLASSPPIWWLTDARSTRRRRHHARRLLRPDGKMMDWGRSREMMVPSGKRGRVRHAGT